MTKEQQFRVTPQVAYNEQNIIEYISREMGIDRRTISHVRVLKKSIDARQRQIYVNLTLRIYINEEPSDEAYVRTEYPDVSKAPQGTGVGIPEKAYRDACQRLYAPHGAVALQGCQGTGQSLGHQVGRGT